MLFDLQYYIYHSIPWRKYHIPCFNFLLPMFCAIFVLPFVSTMLITLFIPCYHFYFKNSIVFTGTTKEKKMHLLYLFYLLFLFFFSFYKSKFHSVLSSSLWSISEISYSGGLMKIITSFVSWSIFISYSFLKDILLCLVF